MNIERQNIKIDGRTHSDVICLRVTPEKLQDAILLVLNELADMSWLEKLNEEALKESYRESAQPTVSAIRDKIKNDDGSNDPIKAGQYLVSHLGKRAIVTELGHKDIPAGELLSRRILGAEGFDFYTEKLNENLIVCGESKFVNGVNAYSDSLNQIKDFIDRNQHKKDIQVIFNFTSPEGRQKMNTDEFGVAAAFSTTNRINTLKLVENIARSASLTSLLDRQLIILVGVDFGHG
jgi:hypothetical protein